MQAILRIIRNRWFIALLGLLAIAIVIWLIGPLIAIAGWEPLDTITSRLVAIAAVVLFWGLNQLWRYFRARTRNQQMLETVVGQANEGKTGDFAARESAEELEILQQRLDEAIHILKESKLGGKHNRQFLYQLPWYIFIGPPGSGKTTALLNSGLRFPLEDKLGRDAIHGIGGTRNCDWWFTDDAVLLDTAGRYTTQDSYEEVDRAAWTGFLDLLKKHRKRRPINGVLVAISTEDLLQQSELERQNHGHAIRKRIQELHDRFGIRFPIYVLFTKCDLLAGFNEFFDNLGREERKQVWGMTFPTIERDDKAGCITHFEEQYSKLEQRINDRLIDRLEQERDVKRRALIYSFPQQFSTLKEAANRFLQEVFSPNRFEESPMVRGVYFTSGTQEGTPIDRLLGTMAQEFGLDRQLAPAFSGQGRSYFLNRLFNKVVFPEAHLAGINMRAEQRRAWMQRTAYATAISIAIMAGIAWFTSYSRNLGFVQQVATKSEEAEKQLDAISPTDLSVTGILPPLDSIQHLPGGYAEKDSDIPLLMGLGLYQGDKLGEEAQIAYFRALKNLFLPRLILSLEDQLQQRGNNPDYRYEALKVYLMLDDPEHFDPDVIKAWLVLHWQLTLSGPENAQIRQALTGHLDALLQQLPYPLPLPLNQELIAGVRDDLLRVPLANRIYNRIKRTSQLKPILPFRLGVAIGPDAGLVFDRKSGQPLDAEIPGLFTYDGYHRLFLKEHLAVAGKILAEKWILGPRFDQVSKNTDLTTLSSRVRSLYYREYIQIWDQLLNDIRIIPFSSMKQAAEVLNILSGPTSPLRRLLTIVDHETSLGRLPGGVQKAAAVADKKLSGLTGTLAEILQISPADEARQEEAPATATIVDQHFAKLHQMIRSSEGTPPPIERTIAMLNELYIDTSSIASAANQSNRAFNAAREQTGGSGGIAERLKLEAKRQPKPLSGLLTSIADGTSNLTISGLRSHLNAVWRTKVLPFYQRGLANRYPLNRKSRKEATIDDFGRFFSPGGLMDAFFNNYLKDFVDTSRSTWRWTASGNKALGIPTSTLRQFQRAATIRDTFFGSGSPQPSIHFDMKPIRMDTTISQFTLLLDGQRVTYNHGPARWSRLRWPDEKGGSEAKILLSPPAGNKPSGISEDGPWGWFRLLDRSRILASDSPESFQMTFDIGGRKASFMLRASSAYNPFQLKELKDFRCPNRL